jgi:hypothetical protein
MNDGGAERTQSNGLTGQSTPRRVFGEGLSPVSGQPVPDRALPPLPVSLTSFVGRETETEQVSSLIRRSSIRLVTLTGPGGVGKTRLALRVAAEVAGDFRSGVAFVPLASLRDPARVLGTIARSLAISVQPDRPIVEQLIGALRDQHFLLVLDNLEHLPAAAPELTQVLSGCPDLTMLVTSRVVASTPLPSHHSRSLPSPKRSRSTICAPSTRSNSFASVRERSITTLRLTRRTLRRLSPSAADSMDCRWRSNSRRQEPVCCHPPRS